MRPRTGKSLSQLSRLERLGLQRVLRRHRIEMPRDERELTVRRVRDLRVAHRHVQPEREEVVQPARRRGGAE